MRKSGNHLDMVSLRLVCDSRLVTVLMMVSLDSSPLSFKDSVTHFPKATSYFEEKIRCDLFEGQVR